ncbi:winged helix-turn-helix domain-containing protein [Falsarthrobacter nasiphocae]|uniref:Uncharacterized protein YcaQ n=1 Tax=Falsarthrobacter nasiphocae TaxID=189863 RepID=A0AAE3YCK5_9MICC|nr:crosslink repair DNA glycosylase YcaQ family protein [Falsarthrobacter nasiphocae]MDR6891423.1 uncharacterized protein YcaQ [Falsarthrobacter nasiphocae]
MTDAAPRAESMTLREARRLQLGAQAFPGRPPAHAAAANRRVGDVFESLGLLQIDSVSTVARSHVLPHFARLGAYDPAVLERLHTRPSSPALEYWAHEASIVPRALYPALRAVQQRAWVSASDSPEERDALVPHILKALESSSAPMSSRDLAAALDVQARRERGHWGWNWAPLKHALGDLFESGRVLSAGRNAQFERLYVPAARMVGPDVVVPSREDAVRTLTARALRALGIASASSIADYYRVPARETTTALRALEAAGQAVRRRVEGQKTEWWADPNGKPMRGRGVDALLTPFDPLVFDRRRLAELWGMEYALEFYVPAARRRYGYFVMPFLQGDRLTARADVRLDRAASVLRVQAYYPEESADSETLPRLTAAAERLGDWLGADRTQMPATLATGPGLLTAESSHVD